MLESILNNGELKTNNSNFIQYTNTDNYINSFFKRLYRTKQLLFATLNCLNINLRVKGLDNIESLIEKNQSFLLTPNHDSFLDPPIVQCVLFDMLVKKIKNNDISKKKAYRAMPYSVAKQEMWHLSVMKNYFNETKCIPLNRRNIGLKDHLLYNKIFNENNNILMFPQGTRSLNGDILKAGPTASITAYYARDKDNNKIKYVPTLIDGSFEIWPKKLYTGLKYLDINKNLSFIYTNAINMLNNLMHLNMDKRLITLEFGVPKELNYSAYLPETLSDCFKTRKDRTIYKRVVKNQFKQLTQSEVLDTIKEMKYAKN